MSTREARKHAARLGMSAWQAETAVVGAAENETLTMKCVGFVGIGMIMAEGETWEDALSRAARVVFSA